MTSTQLLDLLEALWRQPLGLFWTGVAWLLDHLRHLGPVQAGLLALLPVAACAALAWALQKRLRDRLGRPPAAAAGGTTADPPEGDPPASGDGVSEGGTMPAPAAADPLVAHRLTLGEIVRLEVGHSPLFLPFKPLQLLGRGIKALGRGLRRLFRRRKKGREGTSEEAEARVESAALVATLGPSLLLGALLTAGLYLTARLSSPLVAARLELAEGLSPWQFLVFGRRPELAWYLPLERFPYLAGLLAVVFWLAVWWLAAAAARAVHWRYLGRDLAWRGEDGKGVPAADDQAVLSFWRRWAGATDLWRADDSYRRWARWPVALAGLLLAWAWASLGGDPYRLGPSELAVTLVLWLSWGLHLLLRGQPPVGQGEGARQARPADAPEGWEAVLRYLVQHDHLLRPEPFSCWPLSPAAPTPLAEGGPRLISPLVGQLLPGNGHPGPHLTAMQQDVLGTLALQGYVHSDPPRPPDSLTLGRGEQEVLEDRSGLRHRNLVVLGPEGTGKSTLALLAVANHVLVHARASLVIVADEEHAGALARRFRQALDVTPLRWSVRVRSPGDDLMTDLSRGIVPDVLVIGLRDLVVTLLDRSDTFEPFLRNLGLLVIDDMESFTGPREVHGQLAFRRLVHRIEELKGVEELGGRDLAAPQILVLGCDGMHESSEWAQSLLGVDAVTRRYPETPGNGQAASPAVEHRLHRLRDFRTDTGELLGMATLIAACEAKQVPWHYRLCGDGCRHLGRGPLLLQEEPRCFTESAEAACLVLLEGTWSEVRREVERLRRAGTDFARRRTTAGTEPEPVALVTQTDPDVEMAFTQLDPEFVLTPALSTLPRPVLRPPTGRAVGPHLSADLTQHWTEVGDVTRIFGDTTAQTLRELADQNLLQAEERTDVAPKVNDYLKRVYVRALARAVQGSGGSDTGTAPGPMRSLLPPKVAQVELVAAETVAVRERASLLTLTRTDTASAPFVYYPGRIFRDARGAFVVVGRASGEVGRRSGEAAGADRGESPRQGDVLVEPILTDAVSSPRRRLSVTRIEGRACEDLRQSAGGAFFDRDRVLLGHHPIALALQPVEIELEHVATYRLGPVHTEVRQRSLLEPGARESSGQGRLETVALGLFPDPGPGSDEEASSTEPDPPRLGLDEARLLSAAMRAVLPAMYRGGGDSIGVALQVAAAPATGGEEIQIHLFDTDAGGNGTARAIYRDGVDLLLRLCRLLVERVLSLDRLIALHDDWGDRQEIVVEAREEVGGGQAAEQVAEERRRRHQERRHRLLEWLDSRLPLEGGAESRRDLARYFRSGDEPGEGDVIDLGRCWYSADGAVTDLLWSKHRWLHPDSGEVMLDLGVDRQTYLKAKELRQGRDSLEREQYRELKEEQADRGEAVSPQPVWCGSSPGQPCTDRDLAANETFGEIHLALLALAGQAGRVLDLLGERLVTVPAGGSASLAGRLTAFVRGIPNLPGGPTPSESGPGVPHGPVESLLERRGSSLSKALLLAVLLQRQGHQTGLFLSLDEHQGGAFAGVEEGAIPGAQDPHLWAEAGLRSGGRGTGKRFLPIDVTRPGPMALGEVPARRPECWSTWVFLPLFDFPDRPEEPVEAIPEVPPAEAREEESVTTAAKEPDDDEPPPEPEDTALDEPPTEPPEEPADG